MFQTQVVQLSYQGLLLILILSGPPILISMFFGLLVAIFQAATQIQEQTLSFLREYCKTETSPLCGNSVWQDRQFLQKYMPHILDFLHYRIVDVSSFKEMINRWYPDDPHAEFVKEDKHRALDDIKESIAELSHYRKYFFV